IHGFHASLLRVALDNLDNLDILSAVRNRLASASPAPRPLPKRGGRRSTGPRADPTVPEEGVLPNTAQRMRALSARGLEALLQCLRRYVEANPSKFTTLVREAGRRRVRIVVLRRHGKRP